MQYYRQCKFGVIFLLFFLLQVRAAESFELNVLNRCDAVAALWEHLKKSSPDYLAQCRKPRNEVERAVFSRLPDEDHVCLLETVNSPLIQGFSCFQLEQGEGEVNLTCMRHSDYSQIADYKDRFKSVGLDHQQNYLSAIQTCPAGNGSASLSAPTLLPWTSALISKLEFGFTAPLGKGATPNAVAQHAFASVDPSLTSGRAIGLEIVSIQGYSKEQRQSVLESKKINSWQLTFDNDQLKATLLPQLKKLAGNKIYFTAIPVDIRNTEAEWNIDQKKDLLRQLGRIVLKNINENGFRSISSERYLEIFGASRSSLIRKMSEVVVPYGLRDLPTPRVFSLDISSRDSNLSCTQNNAGALGATLFLFGPASAQSGSDFGSLGLFFIAAGRCATSASAQNLLEDLGNEARIQITKYFLNK